MNAPVQGNIYTDARGRSLKVYRVDLENKLDRHVQGKIKIGDDYKPYSCSLLIWQHVWRDKEPPADRE